MNTELTMALVEPTILITLVLLAGATALYFARQILTKESS